MQNKNLTVLNWFLKIHKICSFQTREHSKVGVASNSEIRRWFKNKAVYINNKVPDINDMIEDYMVVRVAADILEIESVMLFKNSKARIKLW